jgi:peptide/nickel transport system substrate-binding protein
VTSRRSWYRTVLGAASATVLVCTALAFETATPTAAASSAPLVIVQGSAPVSLNPVDEADWITRESIGYMYDPLIYAGPDDTYRPGLATSWKSSDHGMVWTFQLRKGVTFQDGTPWNAQAAVYNFTLNLATTSKNYSDFEPWVKSVTATGPYTLKITLGQPYATLLDDLTWAPLFVSPTAYKKEGATGFAEHPVGTGPYLFGSYTPNAMLVLKRNPNYWGGEPTIPEIKIEVVPSATTQELDMEAGAADFMYNVPASDAATLKAHGIEVKATPIANGQMVSFNLSKGPTADVKVRTAIMEAINRTAINQVVFKGYSEVSRAGVPSSSPFYNGTVPQITYSQREAEATLNADGWKMGPNGYRVKDGKPLAITILTNPNPPWPTISPILAEELGQVGFQTKIVSQDWATYLNSMRAGDYNISYWSLASFTIGTWDGMVNMETSNYWNVSQIAHVPSLATLSAEINQIYALETGQSNDVQRAATLLKWQKLDYQYQLVGWLFTNESIFAVSPKLSGYSFNNWPYLFLNQTSRVS